MEFFVYRFQYIGSTKQDLLIKVTWEKSLRFYRINIKYHYILFSNLDF
jgi:hypothetical protein